MHDANQSKIRLADRKVENIKRSVKELHTELLESFDNLGEMKQMYRKITAGGRKTMTDLGMYAPEHRPLHLTAHHLSGSPSPNFFCFAFEFHSVVQSEEQDGQCDICKP